MNTGQKILELSVVEITKSLLSDLEELSRCAGEPVAAVFVDSLLRKIHDMLEQYMGEPYTEVAIALHDALAHQNRWLDYTGEQYQNAYNLFLDLVDQETISNTEVEKSIIALENIGFNTLPFSISFDDNIREENS